MNKKAILSVALAASTLLGQTSGVLAKGRYADTLSVVFSDEFNTPTDTISTSGVPLNENWYIVSNDGNNMSKVKIFDGMLGLVGRHDNGAWRTSLVECRSDDVLHLSAENTIEFDMSNLSTVNVTSNMQPYHSAIFSRFALSEDGNSYYEIGISAGNSIIDGYKLPDADANGVPQEGYVTDADHAYRLYFRKVENGTTVYMKWDSAGDNGLYDASKAKFPSYTYVQRLASTWLDYNPNNVDAITIDNPVRANNHKAHVKVKTTATGVEYTVSGVNLSSFSQSWKWQGSYTDSAPLARNGAPFRFGCDAGFAGMGVDNVVVSAAPYIEIEDAVLPFRDDFSSYTSENAYIGSDTDAVWYEAGKVKQFAQNDGFRWVTSAYRMGQYISDTDQSGAYVKDGKLHVKDRFWKNTTANVDLMGKEIAWVNAVKGTTISGNNRRGIRALISEDENSYYQFIVPTSGSMDQAAGYTVGVPCVQKVVGGVVKYRWQYEGDLRFTGSEKWYVTFNPDGSVTWSLTDVSNDEKEITGMYMDTELSEIMDTVKYPVGVVTSGDYFMTFDDIQFDYVEKLENYNIKDEDTVTVNIQPIFYKGAAEDNFITTLVSYYSADDELLKTVSHITSMENPSPSTTDSFDVPSVSNVLGAVRAKLFMFDGAITNAVNISSTDIE